MEELKDCTDKFIYIDGYRFTRDEKTNYYRCNALRKRLHQYIWEKHNGKTDKGYHVHHIDENKLNNHISNLELMHGSKHISMHMNNLTDEQLEDMRINLKVNAQPKAKEWHATEEGSNWHREHYERMKDKLHAKHPRECKQCGKDYDSLIHSKFCSNNCKSKWRRESGIDNVTRCCIACGNDFEVNKYYKNVTCSKSCSNRTRAKDFVSKAIS